MVIDTAQAVLLFVLIVLTILLVVLGIQVFFILKEFRQTVSKANKVLDDTSAITESVSAPLSSLSTITSGIKAGAKIARFFRSKKRLLEELTEEDEDGK